MHFVTELLLEVSDGIAASFSNIYEIHVIIVKQLLHNLPECQ